MASLTEICNFALNRIGEKYITSINEDSEEGRACLNAWPVIRDEVLRSHEWNCIIARASLSRLAEEPEGDEWDYKFELPNDCLRILDPIDETTATYRIEGDELLCNLTSISIRYLQRTTETGRYDSLLTTALGARLALELAYRLSRDHQLQGRMRESYEYELKRARSIDRREGREVFMHESGDTAWSSVGR